MSGWLDCESPETTEQSLSALLGIGRAALHARCRDFDLDRFYEHEWGPASELPRRVLDIEVEERQYPTYYFHATRVMPAPALFASGILSLREALNDIWGALWPLASQYCSRGAWQEFRTHVETNHPCQNAYLYRMKANNPAHGGPFGFLIREVPLYKAATRKGPWHDYLGVPEIVEDICTAFQQSFGVDLVNDYLGVSRPCLVKFKAQGNAVDVATAFLYLCHSIHAREIDAFDLGVTYDAEGHCIPASDIIAVEIDPCWRTGR